MRAKSTAEQRRAEQSKAGPTVNLILRTPRSTNHDAARKISSSESVAERGESSTPSSGMQYLQRKLHLSVREIRRYVCSRPNESVSGEEDRASSSSSSSTGGAANTAASAAASADAGDGRAIVVAWRSQLGRRRLAPPRARLAPSRAGSGSSFNMGK